MTEFERPISIFTVGNLNTMVAKEIDGPSKQIIMADDSFVANVHSAESLYLICDMLRSKGLTAVSLHGGADDHNRVSGIVSIRDLQNITEIVNRITETNSIEF